MKKVIIIGSNSFGQTTISEKIKKVLETNENILVEAFKPEPIKYVNIRKNLLYDKILDKPIFYDKPKSKFHR